MELCKQTKTHTSAASAHSSQTSQPPVSNTLLFLEQDRGQDICLTIPRLLQPQFPRRTVWVQPTLFFPLCGHIYFSLVFICEAGFCFSSGHTMSKRTGRNQQYRKKSIFYLCIFDSQQCCETNARQLAKQPVGATCHIYHNYEAIFDLIARRKGCNKCAERFFHDRHNHCLLHCYRFSLSYLCQAISAGWKCSVNKTPKPDRPSFISWVVYLALAMTPCTLLLVVAIIGDAFWFVNSENVPMYFRKLLI